MTTQNNPIPSQNMCMLTVVFPLTTDAEAMEFRKTVLEACKPITMVKTDFRIVETKGFVNGG